MTNQENLIKKILLLIHANKMDQQEREMRIQMLPNMNSRQLKKLENMLSEQAEELVDLYYKALSL